MKRLLACVISLACVCAFSLALVGCGPDYRPNFEGAWRNVSLFDSAGEDHTNVIDQLAAADRYITLTLSAEGDEAYLDMAGQTDMKGTWKATGEDTCTLSFEGYDELKGSLSEDGILTVDENGQTMTFERLVEQGSQDSSAEEPPLQE